MESPTEPRGRNYSHARTLILAQWNRCKTSDMQNDKIITVCCYKATKFVAICYGRRRKLRDLIKGFYPQYVHKKFKVNNKKSKTLLKFEQKICLDTSAKNIYTEAE